MILQGFAWLIWIHRRIALLHQFAWLIFADRLIFGKGTFFILFLDTPTNLLISQILVFQKELMSTWVVVTSSVLLCWSRAGKSMKTLTDRWPFLKGDKHYMYDYISAFKKYIWISVLLDIKRNWTMFGKCMCAYHILKIHINIMPKMNSGPHTRLLHLNTHRREL